MLQYSLLLGIKVAKSGYTHKPFGIFKGDKD
jgi:hypothetical protein